MKYRSFTLSLTLLLCGLSAQAQIRFTEDPTTAINMDIEAKSESAIFSLQTYSRTNQIMPDAYVVITMMNDSILKLTGRVRNDNKMIESDSGHGFADRFNSQATFMISPMQAEMFKAGIKNIMIRMAPNAFYHEWKDDVLGKPLYERYLISKENVMFKKK